LEVRTPMNRRHAAALALVGWYLMMPPESGDKGAPLSKWEIVNSFDDAENCQVDRHDFSTDGMKRLNAPKNKADLKLGLRFIESVCIATDDPRLKGN
jgi:hypothetical protein